VTLVVSFSYSKMFPDTFSEISLTFCQFSDIFPTVIKFPDISRFSIQVVTLIWHALPYYLQIFKS